MVNHLMRRELGLVQQSRKSPEPKVRVRNRTGKEEHWGPHVLPADSTVWTAVPKSLAERLAKMPSNYEVWDQNYSPEFDAQTREECKPWEMVPRLHPLNALLSIVILGCNQYAYTEKCLRSIYQHTKCRFEIVFVDNGSDDETVQMPHNWPKVRYIRSDVNLGVAAGRNLGLKHVKGELVCILDNDLEVVPEWDQRLLEALGSAPDVGAVGTHGSTLSETGHFVSVPRDGIQEAQILQGLTQIFWTDILEQVGTIDENMVWHEDSEFTYRIFKAGYRLLCVPINMPHKGSVTTSAVRKGDYSSRHDVDRVYLRKKLADENTIYIHRTILPSRSHNSLCEIARGAADALREFGYTVIRRPSLKHEYPLLQNATAFTMIFRGKTFACYHAENDRMPERFVKGIDVDYNLCVSQHVYDVLLNSGVDKKKLVLCHLNHVDSSVFHMQYKKLPAVPKAKREKKPFRFLWVGSSQPRKGIDILLKAFGQAFDKTDNVELYLKDGIYGQRDATTEMIAKHPLKSKIIHSWGTISDDELAELYRSASYFSGAFVHPHRAEGFGKTPIEAAMCGCRIGMTGWSATNEFFDKRTMFKFPYRMVRSTFHNHPGEPYYSEDEEQPEWAEPNAAAIAGWMRKVWRESSEYSRGDWLPLHNELKCVAADLAERFDKTVIAREFIDTIHRLVTPPSYERPKADDKGFDYWHEGGEGYRRFTDPEWIQFGKDQADLLVELFNLKRKQAHPVHVLHVGAEQGHVVRALRAMKITAYGLEVSDVPRVEYTREFGARRVMQTGDLLSIPKFDREYDLIYITEALEHIPPELVREGLKNIDRVLKPKGMICLVPTTLEYPRLHDDPTHKTLREAEWWHREFETIFKPVDGFDWTSIFQAMLPKAAEMQWQPWVGEKKHAD